jgi:hypothetical protein
MPVHSESAVCYRYSDLSHTFNLFYEVLPGNVHGKVPNKSQVIEIKNLFLMHLMVDARLSPLPREARFVLLTIK